MKQQLIIAVTEHRAQGYILMPYLISPSEHGPFYTISKLVRAHDIPKENYDFSDAEKQLIQLIENYADEQLAKRFSKKLGPHEFFNSIDSDFFESKVTPYIEEQISACISIIQEHNIPLYFKKPKYLNLYDEDRIEIAPNKSRATFHFRRNENGIRYSLRLFNESEPIPFTRRNVLILTNNPCTIIASGKLYSFKNLKGKNLFPFLHKEFIFIPKSVEDKYLHTFVKNIIRDHKVTAKGFVVEETAPPRQAIITFDFVNTDIPVMQLKYRYGNVEFVSKTTLQTSVSLSEKNGEYIFCKFRRYKRWEDECEDLLEELGVTFQNEYCMPKEVANLSEEEHFYASINWLSENKEDLQGRGFKIIQNRLEKNYFTGKQVLDVELKDEDDWFDIYAVVRFGDYQIPFIKLKRHILNGIREYELPNGQVAILPKEWFAQYQDLFPFAEEDGEHIKFKKHHYNLIGKQLKGINKNYLKQYEEIAEGNTAEQVELPSGLKAELRSYQAEGFSWMHQLQQHQFGGCLADDMGLGKTLQTITLLLKMKEMQGAEDKVPASLIIVPTSLVHNWNNEIKKFTPQLTCHRYIGVNRKRKKSLADIILANDIVLTTYGTIRNDAEALGLYHFNYLILDESQYIKNPTSKTYKAVLQLKAKHKLVLTGTPIENSLTDLWAQVNFLNNGLLGNLTYFKKRFITPIEKQNDEEQQLKLQRLIQPFILRRTKDQVASDLPPVTEQTRFCEMTEKQKSLYEQEKSVIRNTILENIESQGIEKSAFVVLQGLTRMRQLANHPAMIEDDASLDSGKFNEIIRSMGNLMAENHKVLIFSSFVKHLELLGAAFKEKGWKYSILTGQTRDREEAVNEFQNNDDVPIFLISLKAGGVGLNLTSADYVFIVDPWWNPAAEKQAINRAHRIGQDKKVFVYRFISQDTIEQKIQLLKEKKSALADKFINTNNPFQSMDKEQVLSLFE